VIAESLVLMKIVIKWFMPDTPAVFLLPAGLCKAQACWYCIYSVVQWSKMGFFAPSSETADRIKKS